MAANSKDEVVIVERLCFLAFEASALIVLMDSMAVNSMLHSRSDSLSVGDIVSVRLATGEEIIGKYMGVDGMGHHVRIEQPIVVQMQMLNGGQAQLGFAPFAATAPDGTTFDIGNGHLLAKPVKVRPEVRANYIRMTTGLEVPAEATPRLILP